MIKFFIDLLPGVVILLLLGLAFIYMIGDDE
jgi:hypothetical protein